MNSSIEFPFVFKFCLSILIPKAILFFVLFFLKSIAKLPNFYHFILVAILADLIEY